MESQLLHKVHNFGIYRKGGKRCILQLDFPGRLMLLIQKGHIKKSHPMLSLDHYDSEDGLHITIKLKNGEMVFEADNLEEKYTICCLLGLIMQLGQEGDEDSIDSGHGHGFLSDHHLDNSDVIKDGLLEKKGHTAITTWNKRRIRLTPGELSYFKPGEELALNVIQLWKDRCVLKKHQHNGFTLKVRSRVYSFRTVHDYKATHMTEIARDDWYEAFEKAMNTPPSTSKILDMNVFSDSVTLRHQHDTHSSIDSNTSRRSSSNSSTGSNNSGSYIGKNKGRQQDNNNDDEHIYDSTPDILEEFMATSCLYTQPIPKSLRGSTLPTIPSSATATPTDHSRQDKNILAFLKRSQSSEDLLDSSTEATASLNANRQSREFHGLSPLSSEKSYRDNETITMTSVSTSNLVDTTDKEDIFSGTAAAFRAKLALKGGKSSALKNYKAQKEMKEMNSNNKYKLDGMKKGVCKAYNMFLAGADFRARSLDRNPNRSIPSQFHPIIESTRERSSTLGPTPVHTKDPVQTTSTTKLEVPERTTSLSSASHSSSPSSTSSPFATNAAASTTTRERASTVGPMLLPGTKETPHQVEVTAIEVPERTTSLSPLSSPLSPSSATAALNFRTTRERASTVGPVSVQPNENTETNANTIKTKSIEPPERTTSLLSSSRLPLSPTSSPTSSTPAISTTTALATSNDINVQQPVNSNHNEDGEIMTDMSNRYSSLYSEVAEVAPSAELLRAFEISGNGNSDDSDEDEDNEGHKNEDGINQDTSKPRHLSTFSSAVLMPSTEAATLLIRDKPATVTITTTHEPLTTSTPTAAPKNNKNKPNKVPPLPVSPPSLSRQNKTHLTNGRMQSQVKDEKPVQSPPAPLAPPTPSSTQTSSPLAPPPPLDLDLPATASAMGPYAEIAEVFQTANSTNVQGQGLRLKQIHWTKVGNNQLTSSLWKDVNDVTGKLDLTELEEQFAVVNSKSNLNKNNNLQERQMLVDAKRAQNLGILFCGLKLESIRKLLDALNSTIELDAFPTDRLATLKRYQPTTEELEMYRGYSKKGDNSTLHDVDRFMVELCDIPKLGLRLDMVLTLWEFPGQYDALDEELDDILTASDQLLQSSPLAKVLEYILAIGNFMNSTWGCKQDAGGFQLSSLEKILSVKGRDSKTTLCVYLVKQLKRNDNDLLTWPESVRGVTKCSGYSTKAVGAEIDVLKNDLQKIKRSLKALRSLPSIEKVFLIDVQNFITEHDKKLNQLDMKYLKVNDKYRQLLMRFGEPTSGSSESIFTIVSGFVDKFNKAKVESET